MSSGRFQISDCTLELVSLVRTLIQDRKSFRFLTTQIIGHESKVPEAHGIYFHNMNVMQQHPLNY